MTETETVSRTTTAMENTRNHSPRRNSPDNQRPPGRMNNQRKVNWRRPSMACQSAHALQMDENTGGVRSVDPKADGPTPITPDNMTQTSPSARKLMTKRQSLKDRPTWEKDCNLNVTSGSPKQDNRHANQRTISDKHCANRANNSGEDSTTLTHG